MYFFSSISLFTIISNILLPLLVLPLVLYLSAKLLKFDTQYLKYSKCFFIVFVSGLLASFVPSDLGFFPLSISVYIPIILFLILLLILVKAQLKANFFKTFLAVLITIAITLALQFIISKFEQSFLSKQIDSINSEEEIYSDEIEEFAEELSEEYEKLSEYPNEEPCPFISVNQINNFISDIKFSNFHYEESETWDGLLYKDCTVRTVEDNLIKVLDISIYEGSYNDLQSRYDLLLDVSTSPKKFEGLGVRAYISDLEDYLFIAVLSNDNIVSGNLSFNVPNLEGEPPGKKLGYEYEESLIEILTFLLEK